MTIKLLFSGLNLLPAPYYPGLTLQPSDVIANRLFFFLLSFFSFFFFKSSFIQTQFQNFQNFTWLMEVLSASLFFFLNKLFNKYCVLKTFHHSCRQSLTPTVIGTKTQKENPKVQILLEYCFGFSYMEKSVMSYHLLSSEELTFIPWDHHLINKNVEIYSLVNKERQKTTDIRSISKM